MPTYTYECKIHGEFDDFHSIMIKLDECPKCKDENLPKEAPKRLISSMTKGVVVLTGHELTAKTKEDIAKLKQELRTNSNLHANVIGEDRYHKIQSDMDKSRR